VRLARLIVALRDGREMSDHSWLTRHTCDNPPCINPSHLITGTDKDNSDDKIARGRHNFGERNGRSRLTANQVAEIRRLRAAGISRSTVAEAFGVHPEHVTAIMSRKFWR